MPNGDTITPANSTIPPFQFGQAAFEPNQRNVLHAGSVQRQVSPQDGISHLARGGVLKARAEGADRIQNSDKITRIMRRSADRAIAEQAGDVSPDDNSARIMTTSQVVEAPTKAALAEAIRGFAAGITVIRPGRLLSSPSAVVPDGQSLYYQLKERIPPDQEERPAVLRIARPIRSNERSQNTVASQTGFETLRETSEFLLHSAQEVDSEKFQLVETFDLPRIYFSGRRARVWNYSGVLVNMENMQWKNRFLHFYENFLRGSRCIENRARAFLIYDDVLREGYVLSATINPTVTQLATVPFSFTMFVTRARLLVPITSLRSARETRSLEADRIQPDRELPFTTIANNGLTPDLVDRARRDPEETPFGEDGNIADHAMITVIESRREVGPVEIVP